MIAALFAFGLGLVASQTRAADAAVSDLAAAKVLYAAASYEEALSRLSTVRGPEELDQIEEYRALCLLALGRATDAEHALERLVSRKPLYMSSEDVSPRLLGMLHGVRKRLLPAAARGVYAKAKVDFEEKNYAAAVDGFTELLAIVSDPDAADARASLSDLKQLGEGFLKLATAEAAAATKAVRSARGARDARLAEGAGHLLGGRPRGHAAGGNPASHARLDAESADIRAARIPRHARSGGRREGQRDVRGDSEADDSRLRRGAARGREDLALSAGDAKRRTGAVPHVHRRPAQTRQAAPHADRQNVAPCSQHVSVWSCASRRSLVTACHFCGPPIIALPSRSLSFSSRTPSAE